MINVNKIREEFEIFKNSETIYFDNSSTSQKPISVINGINKYYKEYCANAGRGSYRWSNLVTKEIEKTRELVSKFINAKNTSEVIFTSGATHSSNLISFSWGLNNLKDGDEILICFSDHKSTILPWINIVSTLKNFEINIKLVPILIDIQGDYDEIDLYSKVNAKTKLVVLTHIHNVYGIEMGIEEISKEVKSINENTLIALDASQSVGHIEVNVEKLKVDFLYFSGHKMFAGTGIGVLWINSNINNQISKFMENEKDTNYFESGTLNISGIISLKQAIEFINNISINEMQQYILELTRYLYSRLMEIDEIEFLRGVSTCKCAIGYGIISFKLNNYTVSEVGEILNSNGIFVRVGSHCLVKSTDDSIRVSLHIYNTKEEVDTLINLLKNITNM